MRLATHLFVPGANGVWILRGLAEERFMHGSEILRPFLAPCSNIGSRTPLWTPDQSQRCASAGICSHSFSTPPLKVQSLNLSRQFMNSTKSRRHASVPRCTPSSTRCTHRVFVSSEYPRTHQSMRSHSKLGHSLFLSWIT